MSTRMQPLADNNTSVHDGDVFRGFPMSLGDDEKSEEMFVTPLDWNWHDHDVNSDSERGNPRIPSPDTHGDKSCSNHCWYSLYCMSEVHTTTVVTSTHDVHAL